MSSYAMRPSFAEGQILAAADLAQLSSYPRGREERHNRFVHRWGIVTGLELETEAAEDGAGNAYVRVFVSPGLAVDGEGRELLVTERIAVEVEPFQNTIGNLIEESTPYPVFLVSQYRATGSDPSRVGPCGEATGGGAVEEGHDIRFGRPGDETADQVAAPLSSAPTDEEGSTSWLILVGFVTWSKPAGRFAGIDAAAAAKYRPFIGINAGVVAGNGAQVQLQAKGEVAAGDAVLQLLETEEGPTLRFGTYKSPGEITPLLTIDGKGDLVAKGSLTGTRTGNTVLVQSGVASDGTILPLPPGVTEEQIVAGTATIHVQVAPLVDPATAPTPGADFAALVQECRVDDDRRVRCRICWCSLPFGTPLPVFGDTMTSGPGAVSYLVAVTTSEGGTS
ncbi:MAG TPA: hypothetical protein VEA60_14440 [Allosphingosinicella sp.]|nr:hypothetical protein [Allosphingosinicella sp.]